MLPLSSERYEQKRDHSLAVRLVSLRDLGVYTCQAYNGLGRAASWSVSLLAIGPVQVNDVDDREFLVYVIDTGRSNYTRVVQPAVIATTTTSTTTVKSVVRPSPSEEDYLRPGPDTHYLGNWCLCGCYRVAWVFLVSVVVCPVFFVSSLCKLHFSMIIKAFLNFQSRSAPR